MKQPSVFDLLTANAPFAEDADRLTLYGRFVGSWDIDATWFDQSGPTSECRGEWQFAWILGGRAMQDVLFATGMPSDRFGTTLRCYDRVLDVWHIFWMQPAAREFVHLKGREVGDRIVQEGVDLASGRHLRWSFTEMTPDSFVWLGEVSSDEGRSWFLEQEMHATRRASP